MSDFIKTLMGFLDETTKPKMGPWQKTSPEMKKLHEDHKATIDRLWPAYRAADREYNRLRQAMADEQERWGDAMRASTSELSEAAHIEISEDSETFRISLDNEVKIEQPDWAKDLAKEIRKGH